MVRNTFLRGTQVLFTLTIFGCAHTSVKLCEHIVMEEERIALNYNERMLVCGAGSESDVEGWQEVPLPQAQYHLQVFLQREGFLRPRFERIGHRLHVWSGSRATIKELEINSSEQLLDIRKMRKVLGQPIISKELDDVKRWASTELSLKGYACPEITMTAQEWDGKVIADIDPGQRQTISSFRYQGLDGLDEDALVRYQAFEIGDTYDARKSELTVTRLLTNGVLQSGYISTLCHDNEVDLILNGSAGPRRLLQFSFGASTEELPFADLVFKNVRLDERASSVTTALHASPRLESLTASAELYMLPWTKQSYLGPRFRLARESESNYRFFEAKSGVDIGRYWDWQTYRLHGRVGPTWNFQKTQEGIGPDELYFLSWDGSLSVMNHMYEAGIRTQYEGWMMQFNYKGQREGVGSPLDVDRYELNYKYLWNITSSSPPLFVLGTRFNAIAVDAEPVVVGTTDEVLPLDYRIFYGGNDSLRGFNRKSLDNGGLGYLTGVYVGWELRLIEVLPWKIEPFLLFDTGKLGIREYTLDEPSFYSRGIGIRWPSPFGTLRGSAAKGDIKHGDASTMNYTQEWIYFFGFGQEF